MISNALLILGVSLILYALFKWLRQTDDYFEIRGVPHKKPFLVFGNLFGFFVKKHSLYDYVKMAYNEFPTARISGQFDFGKPFYVIRDPEVLKQMTIKDFDHFEDHPPFVDETTDEMLGNSLFVLKSEKWRDMRATLSPAFTGSKMRQMFQLVTQCAIDMAKHFRERAEKGEKLECEMKEIFSRYTNDVIATTAFGIEVDSFKDTDNEFYKAGTRFNSFRSFRGMLIFLMLRVMPKLLRRLKMELTDPRIKKFFMSMVLNNMKTREEKGIFRPDMINLLMQVKKGQTEVVEEEKTTDGFATVQESSIGKMTSKREWKDSELVAQCFLFFLAGFDSSSTALMFLFYELAINQDIQETLFKEITEMNEKLKGEPINYDNLQKMKYMDMVISESLRLWPPGSVTDRECVKDYNYNDGQLQFVIEKGRSLWIPIYGFHHDPKYFPNPEKFDPERFCDENRDKIVPYSYIPFGTGPRNCIGSRFALMELKAVVYYLLLNFKFVPYSKTQIPLKMAKAGFSIKTERGVDLELQLRH